MGEIFGIGIEELVFIGILLALLFGPESIPKIGRSAGRLLNRLFRSPLYREGQQLRKQIRDLPSALARLAELEELQQNLNTEIRDLKAAIDPKLGTIAPPAPNAPVDAPPGANPSAARPAQPATDTQSNDPE
ncbi:MAG TPA: twin-arginine translocase TatA/TatE family subunit [Anaerolineae bacterium]|nr:twin-arginine translocase TatA/TatE family subunit [Anaerolineae bacterium]